jgi:ABC-type multidrug transport system ATPase subunit
VRLAGERRLLDDVDVRAEPGELVALLGCSGAGKSTLLRALAGLEPLARGAVQVDGASLVAGTTSATVAYLPQDDLLHLALTPAQTLRDAALLHLPPKTGSAERARRVSTTLEVLGLAPCADRPIRDLSGGQRKRVALGVELLSQPRVLLLDEPTAGLDPALRRRTLALFRELADEGRAVLVATHHLDGLEGCDRLVALHGGRVVAAGSPAEVRRRLQIERLEELWERLPAVRTSRLVRRGGTTSTPRAVPAPRPAPRLAARDAAVLLRRELRLLTRDARRLVMLAAQATLIGLAVGAALEAASLVLFMLVLAALWCGTSGGARELVKERALRRQERRAGVGVAPYLLAKIALQLVLAITQAALLATAWVGGLCGLALSSLTRTPDRPNVLVPLVLIPQVLCAGVFATTGDLAETLGRGLPARWAYDLVLRATLEQDPGLLVSEEAHRFRRHLLQVDLGAQEARRAALKGLSRGVDGDDPGTRVDIALDALRAKRDRLEDRARWARDGRADLETRQQELESAYELQRARAQEARRLIDPVQAWFDRTPEEKQLSAEEWLTYQRGQLHALVDGVEGLQPKIDAFRQQADASRTRLEAVDEASHALRAEAERADAVWAEAQGELQDVGRRAQRWRAEAEALTDALSGLEARRRQLDDDLQEARVVRLEPAGSLRADASLLLAFGVGFLALAGWRLEREGL